MEIIHKRDNTMPNETLCNEKGFKTFSSSQVNCAICISLKKSNRPNWKSIYVVLLIANRLRLAYTNASGLVYKKSKKGKQ